MEVNDDPVGIAIGSTLILAGVDRSEEKTWLVEDRQQVRGAGIVSRTCRLSERLKLALVIRGFC